MTLLTHNGWKKTLITIKTLNNIVSTITYPFIYFHLVNDGFNDDLMNLINSTYSYHE